MIARVFNSLIKKLYEEEELEDDHDEESFVVQYMRPGISPRGDSRTDNVAWWGS